MSELKAVDCNGKELQVGDTVIVKSTDGAIAVARTFDVGDEATIAKIDTLGTSRNRLIKLEGCDGRQHAYRYEFKSRPPCCTLQEAADLLEAQGIQVDRTMLKRVLNPRPATLPISKIRLRDQCGDTYIVTAFKPYHFQAISLVDHIRWNEGCKLSGSASGICLNELENSVAALNLTLLDTWSENTEFPELLDKPELLEF